ncbi:RNA ligase family protein [Ammoniphilus sp. YIM 78166]|uniref:ATP-dependent DNA ligase n=1 Tax=Ammoniphilus sp. YIM 78166 TaxID=1644106 RepID=UPI00106F88A6|nr:RNA ligase family protein [Ammoniphilus sp. YIM 78166]
MLFTPIQPMRVSMGSQAFDDPAFIFEPKMDGGRLLVHKSGERVEVYARNGKCVSDKFPELINGAKEMKANTFILDGEGVVIRGGRSNFDDFSYRGRLADPFKIGKAQSTHPVHFVAFDVLYTNQDITGEPLMDRKRRLQELLDLGNSSITPTMYVEGEGRALSQLTQERELEGIVAKKQDSLYHMDKRSDDWLKIKNFRLLDTIILGYRTEPHFAFVVGVRFPTVRSKPVAIVESGISPEEQEAFRQIASQLHTGREQNTQWIEPRLCCRIEYQDRSELHHLRGVHFKGFLFDKDPDECYWIS